MNNVSKISVFWNRLQGLNKLYWVGGGLVILILALVILWYSASSDYSTIPDTSTVPQINSIKHEANANVWDEQVQQLDRQREGSNVKLQAAVNKSITADNKLKEVKKQYEKVLNSNSNGDNSNLDERESKLRSDLANLYWQPKQ